MLPIDTAILIMIAVFVVYYVGRLSKEKDIENKDSYYYQNPRPVYVRKKK